MNAAGVPVTVIFIGNWQRIRAWKSTRTLFSKVGRASLADVVEALDRIANRSHASWSVMLANITCSTVVFLMERLQRYLVGGGGKPLEKSLATGI